MTAPVDTTFTSGTTITSEWLNGVNDYVNELYPANHSSANITYAPSGTGAVNSTVQSKLRETVSVKDFGAKGDGVTDDTAAIQAAITAATGTVIFPAGTYRTTSDIVLKTGVSLRGMGAILTYTTSWASYGSFFKTNSLVSNVEITGFKFNGNGTYSATPFANPYGGGNSVGFTNNHVGITISSGSTVRIHNNEFVGLGRGILLGYSNDCEVINNRFTTIGTVGIHCEGAYYTSINGNVIRGVLGNLTAASDTNTANSKFADGVYLFGVTGITVSNNVIENIVRIGVVLEGDGVTKNNTVTVSGNTIRNMNSCRGTEYNCAIWSEANKSDYTCVVIGNTLDNTGATAGTLSSIGIMATNLTVIGNVIRGFSTGVNGTEFKLIGNTIEGNTSSSGGITLGSQAAGKTTEIIDNLIQSNSYQGVEIYQSRGTVVIKGNTIKDNGSLATLNRRCGILINRYYNDQQLVISGNTFISSANQSDTAGQLYGVVGVAGGDFSYSNSGFLMNNQFIFSGTFSSSYPNTLAVTPCSFAYDNISTIFTYEVLQNNNHGNINSKMNPGTWMTYFAGTPVQVGYASAAPTTGTYRQGDLVYNNSVAAGGYLGWVCTTAGTPGTWKGFGAIQV